MRRNFSCGNNSVSLVSGQTSSGKKSACPQNFLPDLAALLNKCKVLWMQITNEIAAIRDDFDKCFPGKSFAAEKPASENMASCRNRMTIMKRVGNLMRSAQRGFLPVCAATIQSEVRSERFDPQLRAEMEKYASYILDSCEALCPGEFDVASHGDQQDQVNIHPDESRTRATVETAIRFWAEQLANVESIVLNIDKRHPDTNSQEHMSGRKILSSFRNRTTMMKQTIRMLSQSQEGLLSGFTARGILAAKLETSSSGTMKTQETNLVREILGQMYCVALETERTYGTPIPEIHDTRDENSKTP